MTPSRLRSRCSTRRDGSVTESAGSASPVFPPGRAQLGGQPRERGARALLRLHGRCTHGPHAVSLLSGVIVVAPAVSPSSAVDIRRSASVMRAASSARASGSMSNPCDGSVTSDPGAERPGPTPRPSQAGDQEASQVIEERPAGRAARQAWLPSTTVCPPMNSSPVVSASVSDVCAGMQSTPVSGEIRGRSRRHRARRRPRRAHLARCVRSWRRSLQSSPRWSSSWGCRRTPTPSSRPRHTRAARRCRSRVGDDDIGDDQSIGGGDHEGIDRRSRLDPASHRHHLLRSPPPGRSASCPAWSGSAWSCPP